MPRITYSHRVVYDGLLAVKARADGRLMVGEGLFYADDVTYHRRGEVFWLSVDSDHRRQGIGASLVARARSVLGADAIHLRLTRDVGQALSPATATRELPLNDASLGFWRSQGMLTAWDAMFPGGYPSACTCARTFSEAHRASTGPASSTCSCGHRAFAHGLFGCSECGCTDTRTAPQAVTCPCGHDRLHHYDTGCDQWVTATAEVAVSV